MGKANICMVSRHTPLLEIRRRLIEADAHKKTALLIVGFIGLELVFKAY